MKTARNNRTKSTPSRVLDGITKPGKRSENNDLNVDKQRTNASAEQDSGDKRETDVSSTTDNSVEQEEDREVIRKMEDAHPDEIMK